MKPFSKVDIDKDAEAIYNEENNDYMCKQVSLLMEKDVSKSMTLTVNSKSVKGSKGHYASS